MISLIAKKERNSISGVDSTPLFKPIFKEYSYELYDHLGNTSIVSTEGIEDYITKYVYVDRQNIMFPLYYKSLKSVARLHGTPYLETIYGQLIPRHMYRVLYDTADGKIVVWCKEGVAISNGVLLRYDSNTIENDSDLIDLKIGTVDTFGAIENNDPNIALIHRPRLFLIGKENEFNEHTISCTSGVFSDGERNHVVEGISRKLINVPVKMYKQFIILPYPIYNSALSIKLIYDTKSGNTSSINITPHSIDSYNGIVYFQGLLGNITSKIYKNNVGIRASYTTNITTIDHIQLNPLVSRSFVDGVPIREFPIDIYLVPKFPEEEIV